MNNIAFPQHGIITALNELENTAKVYLPLFKLETDYIKLARIPAVQWQVKDEVLVVFVNCAINDGVVVARLFDIRSDAHPNNLQGDFTLKHESGLTLAINGSGMNLADGENGVARLGDEVTVNIDLTCSDGSRVQGACKGVITSSSSKVKAG